MKKESSFLSSDGKTTVFWTEWVPDDKPVVAVLQIVHGMSEYVDRYEDFALYLNKYGIAVAGNDHLGHGRTAKPEDYGYMGEKDGWRRLADDVEILHHILRDQEFPGVPVSVLGHSMGSFILRTWLSKHGKNSDRFIIMGTAGSNPALGAGLAVTRGLRKIKGGKAQSNLVQALAFGSYNKRISKPNTVYDWLSAETENVKKYCEDPKCGFPFTLAGYEDLFRMLRFVNEDRWYRMVPKNHPILIMSGWDDPVGNYGKGPAEVCEKLKENNIPDVSLQLYEGMRHELLNERGKEAVYKEIKEFLLS